VSRFFYAKNSKIEKEKLTMAKNRVEKIASYDEQIEKLQKQMKLEIGNL
jgi:hypothetical protein